MEPQIYIAPGPFELETGHTLPELRIAYHTYGTLNAAKDNVAWVCHALTANSDVADWWPHTVEAGRFLDPARHFVVCANIIGSHYGTTGPLHVNPATGRPWYKDFPPFTIRDIVRAQYRGYREEKDVSPDSTTETFVAIKFYIDNWRWGGVPFLLYTGKKLDRKESEIVIRFKSTPQRLFAGQCSGSSCNKLTIRIQPDESVSLGFGLKMPGAGFRVKQVSMDFRYDSLSHNYLPDAYERLLLDAILGDSTLYARSDALEASWKIIDPVLRHWAEHPSRGLRFYTPGSQGPEEALALERPDDSLLCEEN